MSNWWDAETDELLGLQGSAQGPLKRAGITTVAELKASTPEELLKLKGFGEHSLRCVKAFLRDNDKDVQ